MPVLIAAGASDLDLVLPLARRLRMAGGEVRCYLDADDPRLRELGCKIAVGVLDDAYNLEAALTNVHTFVPLMADPFEVTDADELGRQRAFGLAAAAAASGSDIAQAILPVASVPADHPIAATLGEVEAALAAATKPLCRLRTGFLWGRHRPFNRLLTAAGTNGVELEQSVCVSVLRVEDWVGAIAAADDREEIDGTWDLGGEVYPLVDLLENLGPAEAPAEAVGQPPPGAWGLALLGADLIVGCSACDELGIEVHPL